MRFVDLGRISFRDALQRQEAAVEAIASGEMEETVHLLEHPHTFTVGRTGDASNLLARQDWDGNPIDLVRISRGGDVTYHGPGQLVGYPHLDLRRRGRDVHRYLRHLEEAVINAVAGLGVDGYRRQDYTGVWTEQGKLASIGVGVRRWVTFHGFALNVSTDLRYFDLLNPCGIPDCPMTSLSRLMNGQPFPLDKAKQLVQQALLQMFSAADQDPMR
ncbi:MAG TPA: lipoyl(octanoyl) transferase LipB [Acidobacteriota bacterium]|nr:lipoyl(octanoyl) transferase LipB [Acidobacteriota bacterium]